MDPRLLRLYTEELGHLREHGAQFAQQFPKIAARLGMEGLEVADPYVERLLEGFAFLAARIQLRLDAEHPKLIAQLLEALHPGFLAPVPSMLIARLGVDLSDPHLARGHRVPRGTALVAATPRGQDTRCEFRTAHEVTLWPLELVQVRYQAPTPELPLARLGAAHGHQAVLRIRLRCGGGLRLDQLPLERLALHIAAPDDVAFRLHEAVLAGAMGTWIGALGAGAAESASLREVAAGWRDADSVRALGLDDEHALLPHARRAFDGHRLLQEFAALPQRLLFFELGQLAPRLARIASDEVEIAIALDRFDPGLQALVDVRSLALFCTPAINLFRKRLDRVALDPSQAEALVVADRTRPADFEIHGLIDVLGHGSGREAPRRFRPLYATAQADAGTGAATADGLQAGVDAMAWATAGGAPLADAAYYTTRREPARLTERQRQQGPRSAYLGEELHIALVDGLHGPWREDLRQLAIEAWVSNRDLPTLLPPAGSPAAAWRIEAAGAACTVTLLRGPTRPCSRRPVGDAGWQLVNQLSLNHLQLSGATPEQAAAALRTTLQLYGPPEDSAWQRQLAGLLRLHLRPVTRRLPYAGRLCHGHGMEITLELDELAFQGGSAHAFACVLERHLARHAAINSGITLQLRTPQRGLVARWPLRTGTRDRL